MLGLHIKLLFVLILLLYTLHVIELLLMSRLVNKLLSIVLLIEAFCKAPLMLPLQFLFVVSIHQLLIILLNHMHSLFPALKFLASQFISLLVPPDEALCECHFLSLLVLHLGVSNVLELVKLLFV